MTSKGPFQPKAFYDSVIRLAEIVLCNIQIQVPSRGLPSFQSHRKKCD